MKREAQLPIALTEADSALECLSRFDRIVLAVSGGPDSMALLVLVAEWLARKDGATPTVSVATVDHGLRAESASEAAYVAEQAKRLGLPHAILHWTDEKPVAGLAEAARNARYRLLDAHARSFGTDNAAVVTAHHADDQAETFAMRLARGAGVTGLAAMRPERPLQNGSPIRLVRPLLAFPKSRLIATLEARGVVAVEDPTNSDEHYERVRVRNLLPALDAAGISPAAITTSARRRGEAEAALRYAEDRFVETLALSFGNEVFAAFNREAFRQGPGLLRQRLLARLIARYGGASQPPQLSEIEHLTGRLKMESKTTATLGGAMISGGGRFVRVWREAGRLEEAEIELSPGESRAWDRRFIVRRTPEASGPVRVRPLGADDYAKVAGHLLRGRRPPARAAHALPSFWLGQELVAVPSLVPFAAAPQPPLHEAGCELNILELSGAY
jgi:tRNA(Ile)-lysidine synthase